VRANVFSALRTPAVRRLVLGGAISAYGDALQMAAQAWLAVQLTHSARGVGIFAMFWLLPRTVATLVAGVLVDRHRRSKVLRTAVVAGTIVSVAFAACALSGAISFKVLLLLSLAFALIAPFEINSRNALLPTLSPREEIPAVVSLTFFAMHAAELFGLVSGGLVLAGVGVPGCVVLNLATYFVYLWLIRPLESSKVARSSTPFHRAFLDGVRFVTSKRKAALPLLIGAIFALVAFHFDRSTLPLFALEDLHASARTYGLLMAAPPLGAVILLAILGPRGPQEMPARIVGSAIVLAIGLATLSMTTTARVAFFVLVCTGAARGIHYNAIATLLHLKAPDVLRGRVFSFFNISFGLFGLGGMLMGGLAPIVGVWVSAHARALSQLGDPHGLRGLLVVAALATTACALAVMRPLRRIAEHTNYLHTEQVAQLQMPVEGMATLRTLPKLALPKLPSQKR
jgi:MFS family permease